MLINLKVLLFFFLGKWM